MNSLHEGLNGAVEGRRKEGVRFSAQMELDAVDLLEQYYENAYNRGAGAVGADTGDR